MDIDGPWGIVIAVTGVVATFLFGVQSDIRTRYERALAVLSELTTGDESASRHRLGRFVYGGFPELTEDERSELIQDFFIVASSIQRLQATLISVRGYVFNGPEKLLASSTTRMVRFMARNVDVLIEHLGIADVEDVRREVAEVDVVRARYTRF